MPYSSSKAIPYRYTATIVENGTETPLPPIPAVENITDDSRILRSGRVVAPAPPKKISEPTINKGKGPLVEASSDADLDEILKLIRKSDFKVVEQLMQTPSKISMLSLLLNSPAHREALIRVLDQAFVDHDLTVKHFSGIVGNITASNTLSFTYEDLPATGRDHNLALHISVYCEADALFNVLVDTGSSLNVISKSTLDQLAYRGAPLRPSTVIVRAFDGSRKSVLGEVDLPIKIGPQTFQITFQVMDIQAAYNCLLGRPWIHEAGAVTSTLHQKLKFIKNGKLIIVGGEEALWLSHLESSPFISAEAVEGNAFQGLFIEAEDTKKSETVMSSLKDAQRMVREGTPAGWGQILDLKDNRLKEGLGFSPNTQISRTNSALQPVRFHSAGFLHKPNVRVITKDIPDGGSRNFVTPGGACCNWTVVDAPCAIPGSK